MMEINRFKGGRGYVHATDELLAAEPLLAGASRFTFTSRKVGTCVAHWQESGGETDKEAHLEPIARLITEWVDGSRRTFECRQDVTRSITAQATFDENALVRPATFDGGALTCPVSTDFTLWEYLSTLQKILLQRHIGHPQWYFVRLELKSPAYWPPAACPASLTLRYRQQKGPLFLSDVEFDGHMVGEIGYAKR
jgi:hypothetical protein